MLYLVIRSPLKNRANVTGKADGWKTALNALFLHYGDEDGPSHLAVDSTRPAWQGPRTSEPISGSQRIAGGTVGKH